MKDSPLSSHSESDNTNNDDHHIENVENIASKFCFYTIVFRMVIIGWIFLNDWIVKDYDSSSYVSSLKNSTTNNYIDYETNSNQFFGKGFAHWDSVFFMRIAKVGYYEYENFFAFFPLFPFSVRYLTLFIVQPVREMLFNNGQSQQVDDFVISGVLISNICFIISVYVFIKLTNELFGNNWKLIKISTLMYIINPATVFMSVAYTESMYSLFSLLGMYFHAKKRHLLSCLFFCLATATRGNGIALCGFYIYQFIYNLFNIWKNRKSDERLSKIFRQFTFNFMKYIVVGCASVMIPYLLFQYYGYISFCTTQDRLNSVGNEYISKYHPWCHSTLPHLYSYVQSKYWNVGLFKYYEFKQIPNFLLASPMIIISCTAIYQYISHDKKRFISIGLLPSYPQEKSLFKANNQIFVYIFYWLVLLLQGLLIMHVQVLTRFLSSTTPAIYWFIGQFISLGLESKWKQLIIFYFMSFSMVGCLLFSNFYPWS